MISDQAVPGDVVEFNWRTSQSGSRHGSLGQGTTLPSVRDVSGGIATQRKQSRKTETYTSVRHTHGLLGKDMTSADQESRQNRVGYGRVDNVQVMGRDTLQALPRITSAQEYGRLNNAIIAVDEHIRHTVGEK